MADPIPALRLCKCGERPERIETDVYVNKHYYIICASCNIRTCRHPTAQEADRDWNESLK